MAPLAEPDDAEEPAAAEEAPPATPRGEKGVEEEEEEAEAEEPSSPAGDEPDSPGAKTEELQPLGPDPLESEANRKTYINFWSTTYKASYFAKSLGQVVTMPRNPRMLPAASGFNSNFDGFRATTSSHGGRLPQPPPTPQRRANTAPSGDVAFRRAKMEALKELTGYESNFGPIVASFLPEDYVSAHNSTFEGGDDDHFQSTTANTHDVDALLYRERPILARSWIYQPSGYFRNGVLPKFDDPDADAVTRTTTSEAYVAPAEPKETMTTWMKPGKTVLAPKPTGFTTALRPTRITFRNGDKLGQRRARPPSTVAGKKPLWKSTSKSGFVPIEQQTKSPLPKIIASRAPTNKPNFPSRPEGKPGLETTGGVRNWSVKGTHVAQSGIFDAERRSMATETSSVFTSPILKVSGGRMKTPVTETLNLGSTWVGSETEAAGSPVWRTTRMVDNQLLQGHG